MDRQPAGTLEDEPPVPEVVGLFPLPPLEFFQQHFSDAQCYSTPEDDPDGEPVFHPPSPPPIPEDQTTELFGAVLTPEDHILRDLESQGIERMFPNVTRRKTVLRKLLWSAVTNFMEMLDLLIRKPGSEKLKSNLTELHTIFINFHHVLNEMRPPQAVQTVIEFQKLQKARCVKQTADLLDAVQSTADCLGDLNQKQSSSKTADDNLSEDDEMDTEAKTNGGRNGIHGDSDALYGNLQQLRDSLSALLSDSV